MEEMNKNWYCVSFIDEDTRRRNLYCKQYIGTITETDTHIIVDNRFKIHPIDKKIIIKVEKFGVYNE